VGKIGFIFDVVQDELFPARFGEGGFYKHFPLPQVLKTKV